DRSMRPTSGRPATQGARVDDRAATIERLEWAPAAAAHRPADRVRSARMKSIALPGPAAAFVSAGGRGLDTAKLAVDAAAGEHVRLTDDRGDELGLAIADPDNARLRVMATPADGFPAIDGALLGWRVERALAWRKALGLPGPDHAYRIVHGAGDGLPGFACDVLGATAVVYVYGAGLRALGRPLAEPITRFT